MYGKAAANEIQYSSVPHQSSGEDSTGDHTPLSLSQEHPTDLSSFALAAGDAA